MKHSMCTQRAERAWHRHVIGETRQPCLRTEGDSEKPQRADDIWAGFEDVVHEKKGWGDKEPSREKINHV